MLYTCHLVVGSFLLNTWQHLQLMDFKVTKWINFRHQILIHHFLLKTQPSDIQSFILNFSCLILTIFASQASVLPQGHYFFK